MKLFACLLLLVGIGGWSGAPATATEFKTLVVMSYEEHNPWVKEIREGIESVLGAVSELTYFYMNTKVDPAGGRHQAEAAYALYHKLQPHGVIVADDDAQALFVVPFLKNQVSTPIMFNGVNAHAAHYGFPAANVSGILERAHVRESLAFIKQLVPAIQTACVIANDVPAGVALRAQVEAEHESYPVKLQAIHLVHSVRRLEALAQTVRTTCDTIFTDSLAGIVDSDAHPLTGGEVLNVLRTFYPGPILGGNRYLVEQGAWAAVVKTGQEQGETSAEMLLQAMRGRPVAEMPIQSNTRGQRVINLTALESHGIVPRPIILKGATLVRQHP